MSLFHGAIFLLSFTFGLLLGAIDAWFDWMFHYQGSEPYLIYLVTVFEGHEIIWRSTFLFMALGFGLLISYIYNKKKTAQTALDNIFDNIVPLCITNNNYEVIMANKSYYRIFGVPHKSDGTFKCYEHRPGPKCQTEECPLEVIKEQGVGEYTCESTKVEPDKVSRTFIVSATPYRDSHGKQAGIIECFQDITARKELEDEKEKLIEKLNSALAEVKKLSTFLPICSSCKKIRDDKGYWQKIESYISEHSGTEFSHSICPECAADYYEKLSK